MKDAKKSKGMSNNIGLSNYSLVTRHNIFTIKIILDSFLVSVLNEIILEYVNMEMDVRFCSPFWRTLIVSEIWDIYIKN